MSSSRLPAPADSPAYQAMPGAQRRWRAGSSALDRLTLSRACHYHPCELAPTAAELTGWLDQAAQIVTQIQAASGAPASQT